jgi:hypothetical protein
MGVNNILKPARQTASLDIQPKSSSGKPLGMPLSVDVEPKRKKKAKRRKKQHYATLSRMNCTDGDGVIKEQYCPETKKFSKNFYRQFGERKISGYAIYDDGDRWDSWATLLCKYPPSIRNEIMTFLLEFKPLQSEARFIANKLERNMLLIHEAEKAYYHSLGRKRKKFREYQAPRLH